MSVIVKGMEMPEKCGLCDLFHAESPMHCTVIKGHKTVGAPYGMPRPDWCPLVALPDHHGRLGDLDALIRDHFSPEHRIALSEANKTWMRKIINDAPTIVEEEGEE